MWLLFTGACNPNEQVILESEPSSNPVEEDTSGVEPSTELDSSNPDTSDTADPGPTFYTLGYVQGSWRSPIRITESDPSYMNQCTVENSWGGLDAELMLDTLEETAQNLYVASISSPEVTEGDCEWNNFKRLASEADQRDLQLDLVAGFKSSLSLEEYVQAVNNVRGYSADHFRVRALTIDDFQQRLRAPWERFGEGFTVDEVESIWTAAHSSENTDPSIEFYPYFTAKLVPVFLVPGFVLGIHACPVVNEIDCGVPKQEFYIHPDGYQGKEGDLLQMDTTFNPGTIDDGEELTLSFLTYDLVSIALNDRGLDLIVKVNGIEVARKSLFDEIQDKGYIELVEVSLTEQDLPLAQNAENTFSISLEASGLPLNHWHYKFAFVWDVRIDRTIHEPILFSIEDMNFNAYRDPTRDNYDTIGFEGPLTTDQFLVGSTERWSIFQYTDGAYIKYSEESVQRDAVVHKRFIQSVCNYLQGNDRSCFEVFWGNEQWYEDVSFDLTEISTYFEHAKEHADGTIVWRLENSLAAPSKGIYSARSPLFPETYDVMLAYPANTSAVPGWYQSWELSPLGAGEYTMLWADNQSQETNISNLMYKRIFTTSPAGKELVWEADINDLETEGEVVIDVEEGEGVQVELNTIDAFGNRLFLTQYRLVDADGQRVALEEGVFSSGVDSATEKMYQCTSAFYTDADYVEVCQ